MTEFTAGNIPKASGATVLEDGFTPVTSGGDPGSDAQLPTEQAVRETFDVELTKRMKVLIKLYAIRNL